MGWQVVLRAQDFVVDVRLPAELDISWLTDFLYPQFQRDDDAVADCTISLVADLQRFDDLYALDAVVENIELPGFLLDGHTVDLPQWNSPSRDTAVFERQVGAFYLLSENGEQIEIVSKRFHPWLRARIIRVLRELLMAHLRTTGWFVLHAAAALIDGGAVAVAGPKNSGKTHLMIRLIEEFSARPIAFDRLAVLARNDEISGQGLPTMVSVKSHTASVYADRFDNLSPDHGRAVLTVAEEKELLLIQAPSPDHERLLMNPGQFCRLFDVAPAGPAAISTIVFPRASEPGEGSHLRTLSPTEVQDRMRTALFEFNFLPPQLSIFAKKYDKPGFRSEQILAQIETVANRVAGYDYVVARQRTDEAQLDAALLKALVN